MSNSTQPEKRMRGRPPKNPGAPAIPGKNVTFKLPPEVWQQLKIIMAIEGITIQDKMTQVVLDLVKSQQVDRTV